jgi:hypothetical protein
MRTILRDEDGVVISLPNKVGGDAGQDEGKQGDVAACSDGAASRGGREALRACRPACRLRKRLHARYS